MAAVPQHKKLALENKQGQDVPDSKLCSGNSGRTGFERTGGSVKGKVHSNTGAKSRK